jgi:hypothetical protein
MDCDGGGELTFSSALGYYLIDMSHSLSCAFAVVKEYLPILKSPFGKMS